MRIYGLLILTTMALPAAAHGQLPPMPMADAAAKSTEKPPVYDVVSVKVNKVGDGRMSWRTTPDGMQMVGVPILNLLVSAYGLFGSPDSEITGLPKWAENARFDVEAKVAPEDVARYKKLTREESERMLQQLLAERFQLKATPVTNDRAVYALVVAKGGVKMTAADTAVGADGKPVRPGSTETRRGMIKATSGSMSDLAGMLSYDVDKTVVDKTGLTAKYDYTLTFTPDEQADVAGADSGKAPAPPLFTAVQEELGLKLEPQHGPVKGLAVERLEMPTAN